MNSSLGVSLLRMKVWSPLICGVEGSKWMESGKGCPMYEYASFSRSLKPLWQTNTQASWIKNYFIQNILNSTAWKLLILWEEHKEMPNSHIFLSLRVSLLIFFIVVPCILITSKFFSPTNAPSIKYREC